MKYHVLLLEDVTNHGRKGELTYVAPGFARNYLLPRAKALLASFATVKLQDRLKKERDEQAKKDRAESEKIITALKSKKFTTVVKVDHDGHMYGSVSVKEIVELLFNEGVKIQKRQVSLHLPLKSLGTHSVTLKFPEDVSCAISIEIKPDRVIEKKVKPQQVEKEQNTETVEGEKLEEKTLEKEDES